MATTRIIEGRARFRDLALTYAVGVTVMMFRTRLSAALGAVTVVLVIAASSAGLSATATITAFVAFPAGRGARTNRYWSFPQSCRRWHLATRPNQETRSEIR